MNSPQQKPDTVLDFWFKELAPQQWWVKSVELDALIAAHFGALHEAAGRCELYGWRETAWGRLAEVIVLDQFSRNLHRDSPLAFANDALALGLAQMAVADGADRELESAQRSFLYMPYMHSESLLIHAQAVKLFSQPGLEGNLGFELKHREIIERFGRYPHRNAALGRISSPEEIAFLKTPGSSF
jgi:uncharacterized protein (DUF924 family)